MNECLHLSHDWLKFYHSNPLPPTQTYTHTTETHQREQRCKKTKKTTNIAYEDENDMNKIQKCQEAFLHKNFFLDFFFRLYLQEDIMKIEDKKSKEIEIKKILGTRIFFVHKYNEWWNIFMHFYFFLWLQRAELRRSMKKMKKK